MNYYSGRQNLEQSEGDHFKFPHWKLTNSYQMWPNTNYLIYPNKIHCVQVVVDWYGWNIDSVASSRPIFGFPSILWAWI